MNGRVAKIIYVARTILWYGGYRRKTLAGIVDFSAPTIFSLCGPDSNPRAHRPQIHFIYIM